MLTLEADYRLASDDIHIGLGALRLGILPGSAPEVLPRTVGAATARRLCMFADYVDANEALRIGLVDRVVPRAELDAVARELAERCSGSRLPRCASANRFSHAQAHSTPTGMTAPSMRRSSAALTPANSYW
jgi:enoyl-CoA hydratase/carnithine racemase